MRIVKREQRNFALLRLGIFQQDGIVRIQHQRAFSTKRARRHQFYATQIVQAVDAVFAKMIGADIGDNRCVRFLDG